MFEILGGVGANETATGFRALGRNLERDVAISETRP